jgi:hypothetical protein
MTDKKEGKGKVAEKSPIAKVLAANGITPKAPTTTTPIAPTTTTPTTPTTQTPEKTNVKAPTDALVFSDVEANSIPKTTRRKNGNYALVLEMAKKLSDGKAKSFLVETRPAAAGYMKFLQPEGFDVTTRAESVTIPKTQLRTIEKDGKDVTEDFKAVENSDNVIVTRIRVFVSRAKPEEKTPA